MPSTRACRRHEEAIPVTNVLSIFSDVDRQLEQVAERRVPGTEVVDRQLDADLPQLGQVGADPLAAAEQEGLGQLEEQRRRRQRRRVQGLPHAVDEPRIAELAGGHVDRDVRAAGSSRLARLAAGAAARAATGPCRDRACRSTHPPSGTISPVSSAREMNWPGSIIPQRGCGQRIRDSNPAISPLGRDTIGW